MITAAVYAKAAAAVGGEEVRGIDDLVVATGEEQQHTVTQAAFRGAPFPAAVLTIRYERRAPDE